MPEPIACSLSAGDQDQRVGQWRELLARASSRQAGPDGVRFALPPTLAGPAAELAAAEQQCCPFFRFTLLLADGGLQLTVQAPPEAGPLLAAFTDEPGPPGSSQLT